MSKVTLIDVQPNVKMEIAAKNLISTEEVSDNGNIGIENIYNLIGCKSRMVERVFLGNLENKNQLHLLIDEEGTFGQWDRGIFITNSQGYQYQILGNCIFVIATPFGDWIGWETEEEMIKDISPYIKDMSFFQIS